VRREDAVSERKRPLILVVDDSQFILDLVRAALEDAGYDVAVAINLTELEATRTGSPALIVFDVQMPEAYGDELAEVMREVHGVRVPMLLFSNMMEEDLARRVEQAKLEGHVSKRAGVGALVERIRQLVPAHLGTTPDAPGEGVHG
jgi:CheY-like chemotaxis protein